VNPDLSIVMPVYNEAEVIEDVVGELKRDVLDHLYRAEIVLVDDASTDETPQILDRLSAEDHRLKVIHAPVNGGHGRALRRGFEASRGAWIFQLDSDGQQVASEFWELWRRRGFADLVMGVRRIMRNGRHRVVVSAGLRYVNRVLGGGNILDVNVPFKLFHRRVWDDLKGDIPDEPIAPSVLIAVGASVRGWRVEQTVITSLPRRHGPSTVNLKKLFVLSWGAFTELLRFRLRMIARLVTDPRRGRRTVGEPA
jgi:glycosyltransferase involved in cell wall biosynthesis